MWRMNKMTITSKVKPEWKNKTLAEWLKMFSEDTYIEIRSYGCFDSMFSIKRFNKDLREEEKNIFSDNRTTYTSKAIVKRIFQDPSDHVRLIFDVRGDTVHLWNEILMENKDPNRGMMPGLRVPLKEGVDVKSIFRKEVEKWESEPFYMDDYAKSCLIHNDCLEISHDS